LIPATLIGFNPALRSGNPAAGTELLIPPYNGIRVEAPAGASWRDLAQTYNIRADVLFEVNGCQEVPRTVFIPGVNWSPGGTATAASSANSPIRRYPLPENATVLMGYGWQLDPSQGEVVFNSGVQLEAASGTSVLAAGDGTVAFAGQQGNYGNLVVINHSQGLQTRYAQIDSVSVEVGQQVQAGTPIGTIAAGGEGASPRLQFEVRSNSDLGWVAQDPGNYLPGLRLSRQTNRQPQPNGQQ
jgi:lysostaphin